MNTYFLDGFMQGDDFTYPYENKKAALSYTDDEYYYVHSGLFDIFNYSAPVRVLHPEFKEEFLRAVKFKKDNLDLFKNYRYKTLKTNNDKVFGFMLEDKNRIKRLIALGSFDEKSVQSVSIHLPFELKQETNFSFVNGKNKPLIKKNRIDAVIEPLEMQVYLIKTGS